MSHLPLHKILGKPLAALALSSALLWQASFVLAAESTPVRGTNAIRSLTAPRSTPANNALTKKGSGTNTAALKATTQGTSTNASWADKFRALQQNRAFYPVLGAVPLILGLVFLLLSRKPASVSSATAAEGGPSPTPLPRQAPKKRKGAAVHSCNVLQIAPDAKRVWQFGARGPSFTLAREQVTALDSSLPTRLVSKEWTNLWQRKVNIAWLPPGQVFLRVIQIPNSSYEETVSMVELQLEKLSPIPVAQIVWSLHATRHPEGPLQTVIVIIVARTVVEEFLGKLENEGFMADRLEVPALDQLLATLGSEDGAWVYPMIAGGHSTALVAWRYGGVLQTLDFITLAPVNPAQALREQLTQLAWAGELEGWLTSPPSWHLVAEGAVATEWETPLREGLEQSIEVLSPVPSQELARLTATRAAQTEGEANLLPPEHALRYQQTFVDRLWMRALGATVVLYIAIVSVYLIALKVAVYRTETVEKEVKAWSGPYTNAMQLKAQFQVLKDRQELKFAALDCWKAVATLLPEEVTLDGYNFSDGKRLNLNGTAPVGQVQQLYAFEGAMRKIEVNGQPLFAANKGESLSYQTRGNDITWNFSLELKRSEIQ